MLSQIIDFFVILMYNIEKHFTSDGRTNMKNCAIIGFGGMGGWHASSIIGNKFVNLLGIYDINPERLKLAAEQGIFAYESEEALLSDERVDIVIIATPNDVHKEIAIRALNAGKHVISEKPVTLSSADLKEMIDAANKNDRRFTVHQNRRWDGEFLVMRDMYNSGKLGDIFSISSYVHGSHGIPGDWRKEAAHGGGMILDWGVHLIDQMMQIVTDRTLLSVYCRCHHVTNAEVDDGFTLELNFTDDLTAHIEVGTSHFISMPRFTMYGTNGSAQIPDWGRDCRAVYCTNWEMKDVVPVKTAAGITKTMAPRDKSTIEEHFIPQPAADVHDFYRNFVAAINGEAQQIVTHEQMMQVMKIMEAAFESDRIGAPVKM